MDHSGHSTHHMMGHDMPGHDMPGHDMPGHDMPMGCSMNMIFNWDTKGMCVVFEWWHITTPFQLILSCLVCVAISAMYEGLRRSARNYDRQLLQEDRLRQRAALEAEDDGAGFPTRQTERFADLSRDQSIVRALIYATQVAIGFWIMLVFMTYNAYLMGAVVIGAAIGHYLFGRDMSSEKSLSCH